MQPWSMLRPGAAMPRSCWPGLRREPAMVRAPSTGSQALPRPCSAHTLPDSHPCCLPPELEFAKNIMKIAEAGKVSIHQQVAMSTHTPPRAQSLQNPSQIPLDPQHPPTPDGLSPPSEPHATAVHLHPVSGARPQPGSPGHGDSGPTEKRLLPGEGALHALFPPQPPGGRHCYHQHHLLMRKLRPGDAEELAQGYPAEIRTRLPVLLRNRAFVLLRATGQGAKCAQEESLGIFGSRQKGWR